MGSRRQRIARGVKDEGVMQGVKRGVKLVVHLKSPCRTKKMIK